MNSLADEREEDSMPIAKPVTTTGETVLQPCSSSKRNLKRQKIHKESKANLKKQKETEREKEDSCCYGCEEATGNSLDTIFVKGFQHLRPRDEIKNELSNIFGSCGKVIRVFVPMQCGTCVPLGFAFIDYSNGEDDALKLNGTYMGGRKLEVKMATDSAEYYGFVNFTGCDLCRGPGKRKLRARKPLDVDKICYKNLADKAHSKT
ncbi:RNA recognition motif domain-containing protein [Hirschfeldia incana]|nr:RNA recognition motif domain-containing protein [Hirschfeldia incana]KAJ0263337.1 RNA recognition motif domain-containing protein [Hirschfeldia incana]